MRNYLKKSKRISSSKCRCNIILLAQVLTMLFVGATSLVSAQSTNLIKSNPLKLDSLSYALGANIANSMKSQLADIPFNINALIQGVDDVALDKSTVTAKQAIETLDEYFSVTRKERAALPANAGMFESETHCYDVSYAFGVDVASNVLNSEVPIQILWFKDAIRDGYYNTSNMDEESTHDYLTRYFTIIVPEQIKIESKKKLAEIEKGAGITKTSSGLLYRIENAGDLNIKASTNNDAVLVNFTGRLIRNNKIFDTNRYEDHTPEQQAELESKEDNPTKFILNRIIPGWIEGLKLVGKGGHILLWIPSELAYGEKGAGRYIKPNDALYYDIEVLDVITPKKKIVTDVPNSKNHALLDIQKFDDFIIKFSEDYEFQLTRIKFPIGYSVSILEDNTQEKTELNRSSWSSYKFNDFIVKYGTLNQDDYNHYTYTWESDGGACWGSATFSLIDNQWYMTKYMSYCLSI